MDPKTKTWFFLFISGLFRAHFSAAADTLLSGQSLTSPQTLVSKDGNFELGFFRPGNSSNYYVAIWYKKISVQNKTSVWVGNRNAPITDLASAELKLLEDGNLVLYSDRQSKTLVWSTNTTSDAMNSSQAVLGDDGNLVLKNGVGPFAVYWESFDHLSDTWLPGGKIKYDNITKTPQFLTSWRNPNDPSEGLFSMELDPIENSFIIKRNHSEQYWSSGPWDGQRFRDVPEMRLNYIYNFSYNTSVNESYFIYDVYNSSLFSRSVMDLSGQNKMFTWDVQNQQWFLFWSQPRQQCEVYSFCGAYGVCNQGGLPVCKCMEGFRPQSQADWDLGDFSSGGCVREKPLKCGVEDSFLTMSNMRVPDNPMSLPVTSADQCKSACLDSCSCSAYAYSSQCSIWNGSLLHVQQLSESDGNGRDFNLRTADSRVPSPGGKSKGADTGVIAGAVAGIVVALGLVSLVVWRCKRRRSMRISETMEGSLVAFAYRDLQNATKNFSEKIGGGGFGSVFKGTLLNSTAIAVKKLEGLGQGEKQFRTEVSTIGTIQHVNLVRLHGFCSEGDKRLLVYEYMPNGSLDAHMFNQQDTKMLDWKTRYQIALGIARGLTYLHEKCRDCIIHCDIKPENILLDADFCPKVADFGLAKLIGRDFSRVLTTMRGTRGYLAPEWISGVAITAKADVYSYGMMLLEIVSGRRNSENSVDGKVVFFPTWAARKMHEEEDVLALIDYKLEGDANIEELTRAIRVSCWCIQDEDSNRPSMGQVVQILEGVMDVNPPPIPRTLQILAENEESIQFFSEITSNRSSQVRSTTSTSSQAISSTSSKSQRD